MSLLCIDLFRNESKACPYSQNMRVNGKGFPSQTKEEQAVNRLGSNPFETPKGLLDLFLPHSFQESEAHLPFPLLEPLKDIHNTFRLLSCKSSRAKGFHNHPPLSVKDISPSGKLAFQSLVGPIPILVVGILGENGLNEDIQKISFPLPFGNSILPFQKSVDLLDFGFCLSNSRRFHKSRVSYSSHGPLDLLTELSAKENSHSLLHSPHEPLASLLPFQYLKIQVRQVPVALQSPIGQIWKPENKSRKLECPFQILRDVVLHFHL